jgi:hypothetical protein
MGPVVPLLEGEVPRLWLKLKLTGSGRNKMRILGRVLVSFVGICLLASASSSKISRQIE